MDERRDEAPPPSRPPPPSRLVAAWERLGDLLGPGGVPRVLFALTALTTTLAGAAAYGSLVQGLLFSLTLLAILVAHEMGHYLVARRHGVPASLPHFIPLPPALSFIGTMGAVIGMRTDQATRNQLLDIGAAGPLAGFAVALPAMALGISLSTPVDLQGGGAAMLGDSLLSLALARALGPELAPGFELVAHPVLQAAWAGFLVTSINLIPISQLDGGHVLYAVAPARAARWMRRVHRALVVAGTVGLVVYLPLLVWSVAASFGRGELVPRALLEATRPLLPWISPQFLVFAVLTRFLGIEHPPVREEQVPLTPRRRALALACALVWLATFMPSPMWEDAPWLRGPPSERPADATARAAVEAGSSR